MYYEKYINIIYYIMEAVQKELNTYKNEVSKWKLKADLLKVEYTKVKNQNIRLKKLVKEINSKISTYIEED
tara:strand:+ start:159 stop:371 length:213 start_codon:yes stop_codon:yes gene_type:complete